MKSIKNHLSLILALVSILFAMQTLTVTNRSIDAYKEKLKTNYSLVVVSNTKLDIKIIKKKIPLVSEVKLLKVDEAIKKIDSSMSKKNIELLKLTLPKFYKITLKKYPTPNEIETIKKKISLLGNIKQIEDFKATYDVTYKLLSLFQTIVQVFSIVVFIITSLLIVKELKIWQYKHNERMNIMGLFGAPKWLSSAVLFRLAIVDAILSSFIVYIAFSYISSSNWLSSKIKSVGIEVEVFNFTDDFPILFVAAIILSLILATTIVFGHKEEV